MFDVDLGWRHVIEIDSADVSVQGAPAGDMIAIEAGDFIPASAVLSFSHVQRPSSDFSQNVEVSWQVSKSLA